MASLLQATKQRILGIGGGQILAAAAFGHEVIDGLIVQILSLLPKAREHGPRLLAIGPAASRDEVAPEVSAGA